MPGHADSMAEPLLPSITHDPSTKQKLKQKLPSPLADLAPKTRKVKHVLVMGMTGAGKSTYIKRVTGDESIRTGAGLDGVTEEVVEYIYTARSKDTEYEIHLIDTPGFDDEKINDHSILNQIAHWLNIVYKDGQAIAGIIYIHDITIPRMRATGVRNLRMLEEMVDGKKFENITLVTNKWKYSNDPEGEEYRESQLEGDTKYWQKMREGGRRAEMKRFLNTHESAIDILQPHFQKSFEPELCIQMDPEQGDRALGETDAGKVIWDNLEARLAAEGKLEEVEEARKYYRQRFDETLFKKYVEDRDRLIREHQIHRVGRWTIRTIIMAGCVTATVITHGATIASFAAVGIFETVSKAQKDAEKEKMLELQTNFKKSAVGSVLFEHVDNSWLGDDKVKDLNGLDLYITKSKSTSQLSFKD